jgi:PDZ domain-containing protein
MNKWVKDHQRILIILLFPYVLLLFLLVAPTKFSLTAPGGLTRVSDNITIDTVDMSDHFYTIYVVSYHPMTPFQRMVSSISHKIAISKMTPRQEDTTWRDQYLQGQLTKEVSFNTSVIKAYELAHLRDSNITVDYVYEGALVYYRPSRMKDLQIGDLVISINGLTYEELSYAAFYQLFYTSERVTLEVVSQNSTEIKTVEYQKLDDEPWMWFYPKYTITETYPNINFDPLNPMIGGPSGGMIQTLSIYASLLNLNLKNLKIAGTGTIEIDGSIGKIGGIVQKLYTAEDENADVFLFPKGHLPDLPDDDFSFEMVAFETIEEAVNWLHEKIE